MEALFVNAFDAFNHFFEIEPLLDPPLAGLAEPPAQVRIPVQQLPKGANNLQVKGLTPGKHRFFLTSQRETFSPDMGELDLPTDKGLYLITLTQRLDAVLYGKPDPLPPAEGMPGVTAVLVK